MADYVIRIGDACEKRSIENPHQLWKKLGGSKETWDKLWDGQTGMIKAETMNRLAGLGIRPSEYIIDKGD